MMESKITPGESCLSDVLVVDDMAANRAVLSRRLERYGYGIRCVDSGEAALKAIADCLPDVVLLDYMMPQMSGIEVLRALRQDPATRELPVIMVTARAESDATIAALEAGADDYVTKPIDFDVLRARIETHLNKRTSADHLKRANAALDERVTKRSMQIADLEDELQREIQRRRDLEDALKQAGNQLGPAMAEKDLDSVLETITELADKFEAVFNGVVSGKTPNIAQMAEIRIMFANLRDRLE